MSTFGSQSQNNVGPVNPLVYENGNDKCITKTYPINDTARVYTKGTVVKLLSTGKIAIAAPTDRPFGFVTVANRLADTDYSYAGYVTVAELGIQEHIIGYADTAAVATGALVTSLATFTNNASYGDFRTAATGGTEYACGVCVLGGADGAQIEIAMFAQPFLVP